MKKEVPVGELKFGMYVAELDRPWTGTPFAFQGFVIRTDKHLEALRGLCQSVYVDTERSDPGVMPDAMPAPPPREGGVESPEQLRNEFEHAKRAFNDSAQLVDEMLRNVQTGKVLDGRRLRVAVSNIAECVMRNPDALLLVSRLREKGGYTLSHALDVSIYMMVFGRFLHLAREEVELLGLLGLLQDIGKVRLPDALLEKRGKLTPEELEIAKTHVAHGVDLLGATPDLPPKLIELASLHHERQDGTGYPKGLRGAEIPMFGAIAGIADTFDALTKSRPYAEEISPSNALGVLHKARESHFPAALVEQFIQCIGIFPVGSVVELNTGEIGIVIAQNLVRRLKPQVMVVLDPAGRRLRPEKILNLVRDPMSAPNEPYRIRRTLEASKLAFDPAEFFL